MILAYKLFRKRKDGSIGSLFINCRARYTIGKWMKSDCYPTKGFLIRKGWNALQSPIAPHLSKAGRVWYKVGLRGVKEISRPLSQGGIWCIANQMKIIEEL